MYERVIFLYSDIPKEYKARDVLTDKTYLELIRQYANIVNELFYIFIDMIDSFLSEELEYLVNLQTYLFLFFLIVKLFFLIYYILLKIQLAVQRKVMNRVERLLKQTIGSNF
jgi:hypothetical protein